MDPAHARTARAAVRRSAAVRADLRGQTPADRDERLRRCLDDLAGAAEPVAADLKRGPLIGRRLRNGDARALSTELQSERAKVRGMLRRASGGAAAPHVPYRRPQFRASLGDIVRRTDWAEHELRYVLPKMRPGTREYRREAERLFDMVDHLQRRLTQRRAQVRHWANAGAWGKLTATDRARAAEAVETARRLTKLRARAKRAVAVPLSFNFSSAPRVAKVTATRRRWDANSAWAALVEWTATNGRPPVTADLRDDPALPGYATVHRLLGGLGSLDHADLLDDAKWLGK